MLCLLRGHCPKRVSIPTPQGRDRLIIPVSCPDMAEEGREPTVVKAVVRKDAGDDPDVTHRAWIEVMVRFTFAQQNTVVVHGGCGVGLVTKPGLPVPVGQAAINPGPRRQMERALAETLHHRGVAGRVEVLVAVPDGERLAGKTFNPRLGIAGGLSILGNRGTVMPFSHAAWRETIAGCLDVALAEGRRLAALSTGGRGQIFLEKVLMDFGASAFIQVGDHAGFAMRQAAKRGFTSIVWGGFWGKLVKMAQGRPQTHARLFTVDLPALADLALENKVEPDLAEAVNQANTARHALEILQNSAHYQTVQRAVMRLALAHCRKWTGEGPGLELILFDYDGRELMRLKGAKYLLRKRAMGAS